MNYEVILRPLIIAKLLFERTDEDHWLSTAQLTKILEDEYHLPTHRTTVYEDIAALKEFGLGIRVVRSTQTRYSYVGRTFDAAELKLLIDAVSSARFISKSKSNVLSKKLATLGGQYRVEELKRNISPEGRVRTDNEQVIAVIDRVNAAVGQKKKIRFQYFTYNARKERIPRHDGEYYTVSPYRLVWNGDYYYFLGRKDGLEEVYSYRVDRIVEPPEVLDEKALPLPEGFNVERYLNTMWRMSTAKREKVTLLCDNDVMDAIIDRFGATVRVKRYDIERFTVSPEIAVNRTFFAWIFGFEGKVRILGPDDVIERYREMLRGAAWAADTSADR